MVLERRLGKMSGEAADRGKTQRRMVWRREGSREERVGLEQSTKFKCFGQWPQYSPDPSPGPNACGDIQWPQRAEAQ